ncbi:hypothetical protein TNCV_238051, partial [Trichonephila clavipes]
KNNSTLCASARLAKSQCGEKNEKTQLVGRTKQLNSTGENNSTLADSEREQLNSAAGTETTQLVSRNETTQLNREKTTQLVSRNETTQLCTAVNRLQPPATAYNRLQPPTTAYDRLRPPTTACNRLQPPATACTPPAPPFTAESAFSIPTDAFSSRGDLTCIAALHGGSLVVLWARTR